MQLWWHHQGSGILSHRIYFSVVSTGWVALFRTCKPFKLESGHGGLWSVCCVQFSSWSTGSSSPPDMTYIVKFYITVACDHQTAKRDKLFEVSTPQRKATEHFRGTLRGVSCLFHPHSDVCGGTVVVNWRKHLTSTLFIRASQRHNSYISCHYAIGNTQFHDFSR